MIEPETAKGASLFVYGACSAVAGMLGTALPQPLSEWIQLGGTGLAVTLLIFAVRALREERDAKQKQLDEMHNQRVEDAAKGTEARMKLAEALEKLSDKIK